MKVVSPAGDFEIKIRSARVEGERIVMEGEMGVWDSKIYMTYGDLWHVLSIILRPHIVLFLLKVPFIRLYRAVAGRDEGKE